MNKEHTIKIFIAGMPGYYEYTVGTDYDQAVDHFSNIVREGYRRVNERNQLVQHMPRTIEKVVLAGPNITSEYPDKVVTT